MFHHSLSCILQQENGVGWRVERFSDFSSSKFQNRFAF